MFGRLAVGLLLLLQLLAQVTGLVGAPLVRESIGAGVGVLERFALGLLLGELAALELFEILFLSGHCAKRYYQLRALIECPPCKKGQAGGEGTSRHRRRDGDRTRGLW